MLCLSAFVFGAVLSADYICSPHCPLQNMQINVSSLGERRACRGGSVWVMWVRLNKRLGEGGQGNERPGQDQSLPSVIRETE